MAITVIGLSTICDVKGTYMYKNIYFFSSDDLCKNVAHLIHWNEGKKQYVIYLIHIIHVY